MSSATAIHQAALGLRRQQRAAQALPRKVRSMLAFESVWAPPTVVGLIRQLSANPRARFPNGWKPSSRLQLSSCPADRGAERAVGRLEGGRRLGVRPPLN